MPDYAGEAHNGGGAAADQDQDQDAAIQSMVDTWPPLTAAQYDRLALLLRPGRLPCDGE